MQTEIVPNLLPKMSIEFPTDPDFRRYLQGEFLRRCRKNPRYSIRAFARTLGTDASTISQIIRGRRTITQATILRLGMRLGLGPSEMARFWDELPKGERARRKRDGAAEAEAHELTLDVFQLIADWYHYAIFELVTLKEFRSDPRWIAKKLGISVTEVNIAIERLLRLKLLEKKGKSYQQGAQLITTLGNPFSAVAFRRLQTQVLSGGLQALEEIPMELRDQTSMTMAIDSKRLPEAKARITKFRRQLCKYLQKDKDRDSVYQLGISFYPLTAVDGNNREV